MIHTVKRSEYLSVRFSEKTADKERRRADTSDSATGKAPAEAPSGERSSSGITIGGSLSRALNVLLPKIPYERIIYDKCYHLPVSYRNWRGVTLSLNN